MAWATGFARAIPDLYSLADMPGVGTVRGFYSFNLSEGLRAVMRERA